MQLVLHDVDVILITSQSLSSSRTSRKQIQNLSISPPTDSLLWQGLFSVSTADHLISENR